MNITFPVTLETVDNYKILDTLSKYKKNTITRS